MRGLHDHDNLCCMKRVINSILRFFGYHIRSIHAPLQSFATGSRELSRRFPVDIVVDIGVAQNTDDLYKAFPDKQFLLVEANPNFRAHLDELRLKLNAKVEMVFCGQASGKTVINVPQNGRRASAYSKESNDESVVVETETLDNLIERNGLVSGNILLKVDVEGAEMDVLKGAKGTLNRATVVILEVCWGVPFANGAADYVDILLFMRDNGFNLYNIMEGGGISRHGRLTHADFVFVRNVGS